MTTAKPPVPPAPHVPPNQRPSKERDVHVDPRADSGGPPLGGGTPEPPFAGDPFDVQLTPATVVSLMAKPYTTFEQGTPPTEPPTEPPPPEPNQDLPVPPDQKPPAAARRGYV